MKKMPARKSPSPPEEKSHAPPQVLSAECPICHKELAIIQIPETIPLFGQIVIQTLRCSHCGFKFSDVMSTEFHDALGFEARIAGEADLHTKLVRNSSGTVEVPELGFTLEPGPMAEGFYTNMEGLLERVDGILNFLSSHADTHEQRERAKELLALSKKCRAGKMPFTVRVLDPFGGSALIGANVKGFRSQNRMRRN
ncbi:MAG: ZPR1 zinc finger domain-containing protein [Candidatus Iainarchaeum archaeon]|uniref:ZPR1 zinc finger domain-containing protein n=1 Tax=Candidatus Iainarchaeum sp. TaxID=3101447 RepID=A0A7T9DJE3_9ARCH|nr:MAG: ZPR1 zinc finger domain-containing protein [Candidatus Diapherotrites archaeon]